MNDNVISLVMTLVASSSGLTLTILGFMIRWAMISQQRAIEGHKAYFGERFKHLDSQLDREGQTLQALERDLLEFKAELPEKYIKREDWIRFSSVIDAKQDKLSEQQHNTAEALKRIEGHLNQSLNQRSGL